MTDDQDLLERAVRLFEPEPGLTDRIYLRRDRKRRNQRFAAIGLVGAIAVAALLIGTSITRSSTVPAHETPTPSLGPTGPKPPLLHEGELLTTNADGSALEAYDPVAGTSRTLVDCPVPRAGSTTPCIGQAELSPDGTRAAYVVNCLTRMSQSTRFTGNFETSCDHETGVWTLDATGDPKQLVSYEGVGAERIGGFAWSPDGATIAFAIPGSNEGLHIVGADGTGSRLIPGTEDAGSTTPLWSSDGTWLAYESDGAIFTVASDGRTPAQRLASGHRPVWSPDGTRIAFIGAGGSIEVVGADGGATTAVGNGDDFAWSPDGTRIAYGSGHFTGGNVTHKRFTEQLWVVSPDGSGAIQGLDSPCWEVSIGGSP